MLLYCRLISCIFISITLCTLSESQSIESAQKSRLSNEVVGGIGGTQGSLEQDSRQSTNMTVGNGVAPLAVGSVAERAQEVHTANDIAPTGLNSTMTSAGNIGGTVGTAGTVPGVQTDVAHDSAIRSNIPATGTVSNQGLESRSTIRNAPTPVRRRVIKHRVRERIRHHSKHDSDRDRDGGHRRSKHRSRSRSRSRERLRLSEIERLRASDRDDGYLGDSLLGGSLLEPYYLGR